MVPSSYMEGMATTYTPSLAADGGLHEARFDLGDIGHIKNDAGTSVYLLQDEEITAQIAGYGYNEGVARCADSCCTRTAQEPDLYEDEAKTKVEWRKRQDAWMYLAKRLRSRAGAPVSTELQVPITVAAGVTNAVAGSLYLGLP